MFVLLLYDDNEKEDLLYIYTNRGYVGADHKVMRIKIIPILCRRSPMMSKSTEIDDKEKRAGSLNLKRIYDFEQFFSCFILT